MNISPQLIKKKTSPNGMLKSVWIPFGIVAHYDYGSDFLLVNFSIVKDPNMTNPPDFVSPWEARKMFKSQNSFYESKKESF
jgi:hypothetical protein